MIGSIILASATTLLYQNDFSTRTSAEPLGSAWAVYKYDKGGPVAYDYSATTSFNYYKDVYPWQGTASGTVPISQQDGWVKARSGYVDINRHVLNHIGSYVTDEADPALVLSNKDFGDSDDAKALGHDAIIYHPLRNIFTNGVLRVQFDIRQPGKRANNNLYSWLRLCCDKQIMNRSLLTDVFPIELGLSAQVLSGAWLADGWADGKRGFRNFQKTANDLYWYRYCMTCDLESQTSAFEVYELGESRVDMDVYPAGTLVLSMGNLPFVKRLDDTTGGLAGIAIRTAKFTTNGYYGETGYEDEMAYKYDNIKVAWKKPGTDGFVDCYRNDFAKSMRRSVDERTTTSHTYEQADAARDVTFTYPAQAVRALTDTSITGIPYLPSVYGTKNKVHKPGVDGWRFAGNDGYTGPIVVTTNGSNRIGLLTKNLMVLQPMCADVTNGQTRFEYDIRMPRGWNGNSGYVRPILTSNKGYDEEYNFINYTLVSVGPGATNGKGNQNTVVPNRTYSFASSNKGYESGSWNADAFAGKLTPLNWYRVRIDMNLDTAKYVFSVYDLGSSAPTKPEKFDSDGTTNALYTSENLDLFASKTPTDATTNPQLKYGKAIGAYGFINWNFANDYGVAGEKSSDYAIYVDNIRFFKQNAGDSTKWDLLFQNDFSTSQRKGVARRDLRINPSGYIDHPEHEEDFWACAPTYNNAVYVAGEDSVLDTGDQVFSLVQPLGRAVKSGKLTLQYDMRVPTLWTSSMDYFWVQLGGGAMASASTWTSPNYRYQNARVIRTGMQMGKSGSAGTVDGTTGVNNKTAIIAVTRNSNKDVTKAVHLSNLDQYKTTDENRYGIGHWIRMTVDVDVDRKTWSCTAHDMGTEHPTLESQPVGADLLAGAGAQELVYDTDEPISHLHIIGGKTPSYAPWRDDLPGAVLVDNIKVCHDKSGLSVIIR